MPDPPTLGYYHGLPTKRSRPLHVMSASLLFLGVLIYSLFELQRMPYRPPQDMSTFQGAGEIAFLRGLMVGLGVLWVRACGAGHSQHW